MQFSRIGHFVTTDAAELFVWGNPGAEPHDSITLGQQLTTTRIKQRT